MRTVIVINGRPRAGKDTAVEYLSAALTAHGVDVHAFSSIDPVRKMLREAGFPVDRKFPQDRLLLAEVGNATERHSGFKTMGCIKFIVSTDPDAYVFIHMREPRQIDLLRNSLQTLSPCRFITMLVTGRGETIVSNTNDAVQSDDLIYDMTLINNGTLVDLESTCGLLVGELVHSDKIDGPVIWEAGCSALAA